MLQPKTRRALAALLLSMALMTLASSPALAVDLRSESGFAGGNQEASGPSLWNFLSSLFAMAGVRIDNNGNS